MDKQAHWENVYQTKGRDEVSWFCEHLDTSFGLIASTGVGKDASVIDVGGGRSNLVDDLLVRGFTDVSVLDIAAKAIADSKERLGPKAADVSWFVADITTTDLRAKHYDIWHDRAVFHFLTDADDRRKYVELMTRVVKPGGHVIISSFSLDGPPKCSGLDVRRYSAETMQAELGSGFELVESLTETHNTPFGTTQEFIYCQFKKV